MVLLIPARAPTWASSSARSRAAMCKASADESFSLEGLERTDNGMKQSNWPDVTPINQKNYYTCVLSAQVRTI